MMVGRPLGNPELPGDLLVSQSLANAAQDGHLPRRDPFPQVFADIGGELLLFFHRETNRMEPFFDSGEIHAPWISRIMVSNSARSSAVSSYNPFFRLEVAGISAMPAAMSSRFLLFFRQIKDAIEVLLQYRCDRKTCPFLTDEHFGQDLVVL